MSATSPGWSTNEDKAIGFHDLQYHHRGVGGGCIRLPRPTLLPLHSHFHFITAHQQQLKARPGPPSSPSTTDVSIQHQQENINHQGKPTKDLTDANKLSQSALSSLLPTQSTLFLSSPFFTAPNSICSTINQSTTQEETGRKDSSGHQQPANEDETKSGGGELTDDIHASVRSNVVPQPIATILWGYVKTILG